MKKLILLGLSLACVLSASAQTLFTTNANGTAASPAEVIFRADPSAQILVQSLQWQSDTNAAVLEFQTSVGAYSVLRTNRATTDTTQEVASTAGFITNRWVVLQHLGACYKALVVATNNGTNVILGSGGWGTLSTAGDSIYPLGVTNRIPVGATTNWQNGPALFVGQRGRPVRVSLTPALTTNALNAVTVSYQ